MAQAPPHFDIFSGAHGFQVGQQIINLIAGNQYLSNGRQNLILRLNPISDASHTRDRRRSPPDSECFPGTRKDVIQGITSWIDAEIVNTDETPAVHIYWFHGFAGSGKSAISLEIAKIYADSGRLLASYFFFRNAGDRSQMNRFAATLAAQMAAAVPATASFIDAALDAEPGLLAQGVSLTVQLERLVYNPFQAALERGLVPHKGPFLIVVDGLDECEDKQGAVEFIDHMFDFLARHPSIPLRFFIASRVEEHIRSRLTNDVVLLGDINSHSADTDIEMFLRASFQAAVANDRVIQSYVRAYGEWPMKPDMKKLIEHINGSFVLASTIFKFIFQPPTEEDPLTPMDRLPLALEMDGLDGLYAQTLARSQHLPHFRNIVSTIALHYRPGSIIKIATLLGIEAFKVVHVLLNLQAIVHVPGTDEAGEVTLCHTSLRDFLTTQSRSGCFFVPHSFHLHMSYYCFAHILSEPSSRVPTHIYAWQDFVYHWKTFAKPEACDFINEIEQFKIHPRQFLLVKQPFYHTFLCHMIFCSFLLDKSVLLLDSSYLLTECVKQLALAAECPEHHFGRWMNREPFGVKSFLPGDLWTRCQFTEHTYEALQHDLQRASAAIQANFPECLERKPRSTAMESEYHFPMLFMGNNIFGLIEWIVARARTEWGQLGETTRPPLKLSANPQDRWGYDLPQWIIFRFDGQDTDWTDGTNSSDV